MSLAVSQAKSAAQQDSDTIDGVTGVEALPYITVYILLTAVFLDYYRLVPLSPYFTPFLVFVLVPITDYLVGRDDYNPSPKIRKVLERMVSFKAIVLLWLPYYAGMLGWAVWVAYPRCETWSSKIALTIGLGIVSGVNINMAHELIHKHNPVEQWAGRICLSLTSYGHFAVEHLLGHHTHVSTHDDPASSRLNEGLYSFLPRTIIGSIKSAWSLDSRTCSILWGLTLAIAFLLVPSVSRPFFFIQGFVGAVFLEIINYIEHYGLERQPGEPVTPMHSWNAGDRITNYLLVKLQRHSDHHANPGWRYQTLRSWPHSPQLPAGYATMILIALVPPLFFKVMNPRVSQAKAHYAELSAQKKLDEVFTHEYLMAHPEDMQFGHWRNK